MFSSGFILFAFTLIPPLKGPLTGSSCQSQQSVLCPHFSQPLGSIQLRWHLSCSWNIYLGFCNIVFVWFSSYLTGLSSFSFAPYLLLWMVQSPGLCFWPSVFSSLVGWTHLVYLYVYDLHINISRLNISPELQIWLANCSLGIFTWMSHTAETELWILSYPKSPQCGFLIFVSGTIIHLATQAKT